MADDTESAAPDAGSTDRQGIALNAYETTGALVLVAPMPGVQPEDVRVTIDGDCVTLEAELRTEAPKDYIVHEWDYGAYRRAERLAAGFGEPVYATLGNGQLVVSLTRDGARPAGGPIVVTPSAPG